MIINGKTPRIEHRRKLLNISFGSVFLGLTSRAKAAKPKIDKPDYIKVKSFHTAKRTSTKWKAAYGMGENICIPYDKGLISKMYKALLEFNSINKQKPNKSIKIRTRDLNGDF